MNKTVANLKSLGIDMIHNAGSGHPGIVLSAAPILYTLYANHMHVNPNDPNWINRDRFVLSAGHGSALLYACLYMLDFITLNDLKEFRQIGSVTPGHPEFGVTPGVDMSTGPLGQGVASAIGMAMGAKHLKEKFKDTDLINYYVYVLCGDGDLMEGVSYEAASLAGTLNLDNLIILYDSNNTSLDGSTSMTFTEDVRERFDAMGWYTTLVKNGNNINEIDRAIKRAKKSGLPSLIEVKTVLGDGSLLEGTNETHGKPLETNDISQLKVKLSVPDIPFWVEEGAIREFREMVSNRSIDKYTAWSKEYKNYLKQQDISKTVAFSGLGVFGACGVLSLVWFVGPVADNIITSAENDFDYESDYEMERARKIREEENRKKLEEEIKKLKEQDKFLMEDKDEEEKDLPDIAETYYQD